jgi:competence CoiA-like predicted nuclease
MENCFYKGEEICAYELKDAAGFYRVDLVEKWKMAASKGELVCGECGARVYLAAGLIKEPYFAHYDTTACEYSGNRESEEALKGKRLLYNLLKRSFPQAEIHTRYKLKNGLYTSFYITFTDGGSMAVEYRLYSTGIEEFYLRDNYYRAEGILPVYILNPRVNKNDQQLSWYQSIIQKSMGYCAFLESSSERIYLKKNFDNHFGKVRKVVTIRKEVPVSELVLSRQGILSEEFYKECQEMEEYLSLPEGIRGDVLENAIRLMLKGQEQLVSEKYRAFIRERKII